MPQIVPTKDELARMTPAQRERARRAVWGILAETDRYLDRQSRRRDDLRAWGEAVRERARALEAYIPRDPAHIIDARRVALLEATS